MLAKLLTVAALAGLLAVPGADAGGRSASSAGLVRTTTVLMPGVTYTRQVDFTLHGPVVLDVVTAPRPDGSLYTLEPLLSNGTLVGTDRLTAMEQALGSSATVVGVNADYFAPARGIPSGMLMRGGALEKQPARGRSSLGIAPDGTLSVARLAFDGSWRGTGQRRPLDLDLAPVRGHTTLYTPAWGPQTPAETGDVVEDVIQSFPATQANRPLTGVVTQTTTRGQTPIPPGGAVLVARRAQAQHLAAEAPVGTTVEVRLTLTPDWSGMQSAVGGGPLLVSDGKPVFAAGEDFATSVLNGRNARSAIGQLSDGRILLVTVEGGSLAYSVGMSNYELGVALARLGAVTAMALGSGGSAELAFDGTLLTRPSLGAEQPLADALGIVYTGVYAAPPAAAVLSPNGDGVDDVQTFTYKLVRPSQVSVTLSGPDGSTRTLVQEAEQPGIHTVSWDGTTADGQPAPEGTWRFDVSATDDQGRTTTAERDFQLNDTLASLATLPAAPAQLVPKARGVLAVSFQLLHPAQVTVTIEKRSGIVIATLLGGTLQPGPQRVLWNGRTWTGELALSGAYQVHVVATNDIGTVSLTAPFTARRK